MSQSLKKRKDTSKADRLIEAAELLYGRHGLEGVSLRQICAAAGSGDNYAVQYHFGDADGLIRAIFARRIPDLEMRRAQRLVQLKEAGAPTTHELLDCLFRPAIECRDIHGVRVHAQFELALLCSPKGAQYHDDVLKLMPITQEILGLLRRTNPHLSAPFIWYRMQLISTLVFSSVCVRFTPYDASSFDKAMIENALDMATAAIVAPVGSETEEMMKSVVALHSRK